jgi:hypothetical protein
VNQDNRDYEDEYGDDFEEPNAAGKDGTGAGEFYQLDGVDNERGAAQQDSSSEKKVFSKPNFMTKKRY